MSRKREQEAAASVLQKNVRIGLSKNTKEREAWKEFKDERNELLRSMDVERRLLILLEDFYWRENIDSKETYVAPLRAKGVEHSKVGEFVSELDVELFATETEETMERREISVLEKNTNLCFYGSFRESLRLCEENNAASGATGGGGARIRYLKTHRRTNVILCLFDYLLITRWSVVDYSQNRTAVREDEYSEWSSLLSEFREKRQTLIIDNESFVHLNKFRSKEALEDLKMFRETQTLLDEMLSCGP